MAHNRYPHAVLVRTSGTAVDEVRAVAQLPHGYGSTFGDGAIVAAVDGASTQILIHRNPGGAVLSGLVPGFTAVAGASISGARAVQIVTQRTGRYAYCAFGQSGLVDFGGSGGAPSYSHAFRLLPGPAEVLLRGSYLPLRDLAVHARAWSGQDPDDPNTPDAAWPQVVYTVTAPDAQQYVSDPTRLYGHGFAPDYPVRTLVTPESGASWLGTWTVSAVATWDDGQALEDAYTFVVHALPFVGETLPPFTPTTFSPSSYGIDGVPGATIGVSHAPNGVWYIQGGETSLSMPGGDIVGTQIDEHRYREYWWGWLYRWTGRDGLIYGDYNYAGGLFEFASYTDNGTLDMGSVDPLALVTSFLSATSGAEPFDPTTWADPYDWTSPEVA